MLAEPSQSSLVYALDGGRQGVDCSRCGQAARVELHGSRVHVECFGGCSEEEAIASMDVEAIRAELERNAEQGKVTEPHGSASLASTWSPITLASLDPSELDAPPTMLHRTDGVALIYPGRLHSIYGEPEAGKGWLALHLAAEQLRAGEAVAYFDFEDTPGTILARLHALGADAELAQFHYVHPEEPLDERGWEALRPVLAPRPTVAIVDGLTEALTLQGLSPLDNGEVAQWFTLLPRRLTRIGAAVLLLDHVTKDRESRGRFAIGAQHKLAGVDVAYGLDVLEPFGRGLDGLVKLTVRKDRPGHVRPHAEEGQMAMIHLSSAESGAVTVELEPPEPSRGTFRPTRLMERVSCAIEDAPGLTKSAIRASVGGNNRAKDLAVELLTAEGFLRVEVDGQARLHYSERPYREADDEGLNG